MQRRRFKNTLTFPDRLANEAERLREEAETKPPGPERDALLRKARQADTAAPPQPSELNSRRKIHEI